MDIREELTSTIMKMRYLAETFAVNADRGQRRGGQRSAGNLINGLADEIEFALNLYAESGIHGERAKMAPKTA